MLADLRCVRAPIAGLVPDAVRAENSTHEHHPQKHGCDPSDHHKRLDQSYDDEVELCQAGQVNHSQNPEHPEHPCRPQHVDILAFSATGFARVLHEGESPAEGDDDKVEDVPAVMVTAPAEEALAALGDDPNSQLHCENAEED